MKGKELIRHCVCWCRINHVTLVPLTGCEERIILPYDDDDDDDDWEEEDVYDSSTTLLSPLFPYCSLLSLLNHTFCQYSVALVDTHYCRRSCVCITIYRCFYIYSTYQRNEFFSFSIFGGLFIYCQLNALIPFSVHTLRSRFSRFRFRHSMPSPSLQTIDISLIRAIPLLSFRRTTPFLFYLTHHNAGSSPSLTSSTTSLRIVMTMFVVERTCRAS